MNPITVGKSLRVLCRDGGAERHAFYLLNVHVVHMCGNQTWFPMATSDSNSSGILCLSHAHGSA
jgi:hypothetical protein